MVNALIKKAKNTSDLKALEEKLAQAKKSFSSRKPKNPADSGIAFNLVADLIAGMIAGFFIGYNLDVYFLTAPLFLFLFIIFGIAVGFYIFYKDNIIK